MKKIFKWLALVFCVLLVLTAALWGYVHTGSGKSSAAGFLSSALSNERMSVKISGLDLMLPHRFGFESLTLSDRQGEWLSVKNASARWSPWSLAKGRLSIVEIKAGSTHVRRPPEPGREVPEEETKKPEPFPWHLLARLSISSVSVETISLDEPVFGTPARFRLDASVGPGAEGPGIFLSFGLDRVDEPGGHVRLTATVDHAQQTLAVEGRISDPAGGFVSGLARKPIPIEAHLSGMGPLSNWTGSLEATVGGVGATDLMMILEAPGKGMLYPVTVGVSGIASFEKGFTGRSEHDTVELDLRASFSGESGMELHEMKLNHRDVELTARGSFHKADEFEVNGDLHVTDLSAVSDLLGIPMEGASRMDFTARSGRYEQLVVRLDGEAGPGLLAGLTGRAWPGGNLEFGGTLRRNPDGRLFLSEVVFTDESFCLSGKGSLLPPDRLFSGEIVLRVPDLSVLSFLSPAPLTGAAVLEAVAEGRPGEIAGEVTAELLAFDIGEISVDRSRLALTADGWFPDMSGSFSMELVSDGNPFKLNTMFRSDPEKVLFDEISLKAPGGGIKGNIGLAFEAMLAEGTLEFFVEDPEMLVGHELKGKASGKVRFFHDGAVQKAELGLEGLQIFTPFGSIESLEASGEFSGLLPLRAAEVSCGVSDLEAGRIRVDSASAIAELTDEGWKFQMKSAGIFNTPFSNRVTALFSGSPGAVTVEVSELEHIHGGIPARLESPVKVSHVTDKLSVEDLSLSVGDGSLSGSAILIGTLPELDVRFEKLPLELAAALGFDSGHGSLSGHISVSPDKDDMLLARALLEGYRTPGHHRAALPALDVEISVAGGRERLEGRGEIRGAGERPITIIASMPIEQRGPNSFPLPDPSGYLNGRIEWNFDLSDLETLGFQLPGDLYGMAGMDMKLRGTGRNPEIDFTFQLTEGAYRDLESGKVLENIDALFSAHTPAPRGYGSPGGLVVSGSVSGISPSPFEMGAVLPLNFSIAPFSFDLPKEGPVEGFIRGNLDLALVPAALSLDRQYLEGLLKVDLDVAGTMEMPMPAGSLEVKDGYFEDVQIGTVLENISLEVQAAAPRIDIVRGYADAGRDGGVKVDGWVEMVPGEGASYRLNLEMVNAAILRRDDAFAVLGGLLNLSGSGLDASLTGSVRLERAEITIPDRAGRDIPRLEVIEIHGYEEPGPHEPLGKKTPRNPVMLDLEIEGPGRIYVSGRGLESEWKGSLRVQGRSPEINVLGGFHLVRGYFNLLGRRISLVRGTIQLGGAPDSPPVIDVVGEASAGDMTAKVGVSGPVNSLSIDLSSSPPYPTDEILARLLFGRSLSGLTPLQALQLAQALQTLSGGGGVDIFARTRKLLRVDQLELMQSDEYAGEASIRAGKYINERIYLQVEQGVGSDRSKASVEVELTPQLSLETEMGADSGGGVGIKWRWDY